MTGSAGPPGGVDAAPGPLGAADAAPDPLGVAIDPAPGTSPDVRVVTMTRDHVTALLPHERGMFGPEAWTRSSYLAELADRDTRRYLAAEDPAGALLGWAGVRVVGDEAEILTVGTVPTARRRGVGRALTRALLSHAEQSGALDIYLEVRVDNDAARALYESLGFRVVGRRRGYYEAGRVDAEVMHRDLRGC